jgi:hypothetical protein
MPADHLLLKVDLGSIPMLQRNRDPARDKIAAAAHPVGALLADPADIVKTSGSIARRGGPPSGGLMVPSLKPIRLRGVSPAALPSSALSPFSRCLGLDTLCNAAMTRRYSDIAQQIIRAMS